MEKRSLATLRLDGRLSALLGEMAAEPTPSGAEQSPLLITVVTLLAASPLG